MLKKIQELSSREKILILSAVGLIFFMFIYYGVGKMPNLFQPSVRPIVERNTETFQLLIPKINKLKQMQAQVHSHQKIPNGNLFNFIEQHKPKLDLTDKAGQEKLLFFNQDNGKQVLVIYNGVGFDSLIKWLEDLHMSYGVKVIKAQFSSIPGKKTGYTNIELLISNG
ncbi:MAG: type II secretion system protein M [Gammaproteobacteria bacterium]|nr:type II secretion system protein M [Gammaproteobacteria bacterium]